MARAFNSTQKELLRSPDLQVNVLASFFLDSGTYRFCDDNAGFDLSDGSHVYIGANAIMGDIDIRASQELSAEQVSIICDGNRMAQAGIQDPARVLRDILAYLYQQRRVDLAFGFRYSYSRDINLVIPAYAGKINTVRLVDEATGDGFSDQRNPSRLEIILDSLAARYSRATHRSRTHADQLEIDPTDNFYSYTVDVVQNERKIYWGKAAPFGGSSAMNSGGSGASGRVNRGNYERS